MKLLVNAARVACGSAWLFLVTTAVAQVVPTVRVVPSSAFGLDIGLGGRYYF